MKRNRSKSESWSRSYSKKSVNFFEWDLLEPGALLHGEFQERSLDFIDQIKWFSWRSGRATHRVHVHRTRRFARVKSPAGRNIERATVDAAANQNRALSRMIGRADHAFLLKGDVFNMDQIEAYMELKWEEVYAFEHTPHPIEFQMYYSV